eukprot:6210125-Pleurochrysis_carterae.AAC.3
MKRLQESERCGRERSEPGKDACHQQRTTATPTRPERGTHHVPHSTVTNCCAVGKVAKLYRSAVVKPFTVKGIILRAYGTAYCSVMSTSSFPASLSCGTLTRRISEAQEQPPHQSRRKDTRHALLRTAPARPTQSLSYSGFYLDASTT